MFQDSESVKRAVRQIERAGESVSKEDWIELCEEVAEHFNEMAQAVKDELAEE